MLGWNSRSAKATSPFGQPGNDDRLSEQGRGNRERNLLLQHCQERGHLLRVAVRVGKDHLDVIAQLRRDLTGSVSEVGEVSIDVGRVEPNPGGLVPVPVLDGCVTATSDAHG